ncbi:polysaccharide pyruvyl transferase family protein [Photobacterium minamisatsumaniensis]|uniref:polysaccharide pyruvyl transferase family protein n=1 Tax=Photobacterium minamisatsumaniensis TaxID=2910233 RepID=UPI003D14B720
MADSQDIMYKSKWFDSLERLKLKHKEIAERLKGQKVCLLDVPLYYNVGDHLIYQGTEQFFNDYGVNIIHRAFYDNYSPKKLEESDVILLHGGGNFGDLYPTHQKLREDIVKKYTNKKIIILPQTVKYQNEDNKIKSLKLFQEHPNLTFYVRDKVSFELMKEWVRDVHLMPDMAHSLHPLVDKLEIFDLDDKAKRVLYLKRDDLESSGSSSADNIRKRSFDWNQMISLNDYVILKVVKTLQPMPIVNQRLNEKWKVHSQSLMFRAIQYFLAHDIVYTDRLHGFILAYLLGRKVYFSDNSYGKNSTYFDAWIEPNDLIEWK